MLRRPIAWFVAVSFLAAVEVTTVAPFIASVDDTAGLGPFTPEESSLLESTSDGVGFTTR